MSKAFTRESDDVPEEPAVPRPVSVLPPGAKNYLTPGGATNLRNQLEQLQAERSRLAPAAAENDSGAKRQLQALDQRIVHLERTLQTAVVTGPPAAPDDLVRFGATVTVREKSGEETTYRIVGVDETDLDRNWISWLSPMARALVNARVGQRVRLKLPGGENELEIVNVCYE